MNRATDSRNQRWGFHPQVHLSDKLTRTADDDVLVHAPYKEEDQSTYGLFQNAAKRFNISQIHDPS